MMVKKDLLAQDFEGIMKYFRVNIPKRLRWNLLETILLINYEKVGGARQDTDEDRGGDQDQEPVQIREGLEEEKRSWASGRGPSN